MMDYNLKLNNYEHDLEYVIHSWSSYSSNYHPRNIKNDHPYDQSSRWSSDSNYPPQYIILKLVQPSIVTAITFGKFEKTHVCNLRKFTITGGASPDHQVHLLTSGLKNDNKKETFSLKHELQGKKFVCEYIKIVPVASWGPSFNFSIWHIKLFGIDDAKIVQPCLKWFNNYREQEAIRLCLKYFRQKNYTEAFNALKNETNVFLESPLLTSLHTSLVKNGNFEEAEHIIQNSAHLFNEYISTQSYQPKWTALKSLNRDGVEVCEQPGMRGGHQMCIDEEKQLIFLIGGWDGTKDISDFWVYNINSSHWHCISENIEMDGGPAARSCHKICLDTKKRHLYILGRYLDAEERLNLDIKSDFFRYGLDTGLWEIVSSDTYSEGGPSLIFDHQMQYDGVTEKIFVFGGRILTTIINDDQSSEPLFSGLFSFCTKTYKWEKLKDDCLNTPSNDQILSRSGHSMLIDQERRLLYIFAGQRGRNRESVNDFFSYNIDTGEITILVALAENKLSSSIGFTQRSNIDSKLGEIYVLSGSNREAENKEDCIRNSFWVYNIALKKWTCVYKNENIDKLYWKKMTNIEPRPRFAHQLVYDSINKVHFLFGGNPGHSASLKLRLDDFWMLKLERSTTEDLLRYCRFIIRKLRFMEMSEIDQIHAFSYLQEEVSLVIDHTNDCEREMFESLTSVLFSPVLSSSRSNSDGPSEIYEARTKVFDELTTYFPSHMTQPCGTITDFIIV
ncbi:muskelin isoform X1 [Hydra vulgaris]|uniref:muskelin isoform X1 n=1 Tax=Hydra vulgaris TaxID=6087 RepID=UPI001F5F717A|nr:muskelin [Hydra vulgaris]